MAEGIDWSNDPDHQAESLEDSYKAAMGQEAVICAWTTCKVSLSVSLSLSNFFEVLVVSDWE